ncbi:hypothetical protein BDZ89DRAFT_1148008 [Hymenopellis radicata]|nr:hypothetical protein BDZ89DRAFT_1148008 [Hymenopellis radicata]
METPWTAGELSILSNRQLINIVKSQPDRWPYKDARTGALKRISISHIKKQWLVDTIVRAGYTKAYNAHRRLKRGLIPAGKALKFISKIALTPNLDATLLCELHFRSKTIPAAIQTNAAFPQLAYYVPFRFGFENPTVVLLFVEYFAECPVNEMDSAALAFDRLIVNPFSGVHIVLETGDAGPNDHEDENSEEEADHHRSSLRRRPELKPTDKPLELARQRGIADITWLRSQISAKAAYSDFQALRYCVLPNSSIPQYWGFVVEVLAEYTHARNPDTNMRIRRTTISKALEIGPTWLREIEQGYRLLQAHLNEDSVQARLNDKECHGGTKGMLLYLRNL